jgi:hypothetical protein
MKIIIYTISGLASIIGIFLYYNTNWMIIFMPSLFISLIRITEILVDKDE